MTESCSFGGVSPSSRATVAVRRTAIVPVRIAQRLQPLPGEQCDGDALGRGDREQQQQRELPGKALRREPHPRSTVPANR